MSKCQRTSVDRVGVRTSSVNARCGWCDGCAFLHAQAFFSPNLTGGSVFATLNSADNGIHKTYGNLGGSSNHSDGPAYGHSAAAGLLRLDRQ